MFEFAMMPDEDAVEQRSIKIVTGRPQRHARTKACDAGPFIILPRAPP